MAQDTFWISEFWENVTVKLQKCKRGEIEHFYQSVSIVHCLNSYLTYMLDCLSLYMLYSTTFYDMFATSISLGLHIIDIVSIILTETKVTNWFMNCQYFIYYLQILIFFQIFNPVPWQVFTKWNFDNYAYGVTFKKWI